MIEKFFTKNEIKLFNILMHEEEQYLKSILNGIYNADYTFGYFHGKLSEKDKKFLTLTNKITQLFSNEKFREYIICLEKNRIVEKIENIKEQLIDNPNDKVKKSNLKLNQEYLGQLNQDNFEAYKEYYKKIYLSFDKNIIPFSFEEFLSLQVFELIVNEFTNMKKFSFVFGNELENFYLKHDINLQDDNQYKKYGLISITPEMKIIISNIPKIYDERVKEYIWINFIPEGVLEIIEDLKKQKFIKKLALRPSYSIQKELGNIAIALEEMARGKQFTLNINELPPITQLYDKEWNNLWIKVNRENIIFEEVLNINEELLKCKNYVITQVLHLQYFEKDSQFYIKHLDHEYILYSKEEFEKRISNPEIKGKKFKTFKIDDSCIPFFYNDENILYKFLDYFFRNKELLKEYFENVKETK